MVSVAPAATAVASDFTATLMVTSAGLMVNALVAVPVKSPTPVMVTRAWPALTLSA